MTRSSVVTLALLTALYFLVGAGHAAAAILTGALADNGGPTQTMALLPGSPAIDGVTYNSPNGAPASDRRGVARPQGARHDIGAYEYQGQAAASVPAMNEWGLIIFLLFAGAASVYYMRKRLV